MLDTEPVRLQDVVGLTVHQGTTKIKEEQYINFTVPEPFLLHLSNLPDRLSSLGEQKLALLCCIHSHK